MITINRLRNMSILELKNIRKKVINEEFIVYVIDAIIEHKKKLRWEKINKGE